MLGAICGDILGSPYEFEGLKFTDPNQIELFREDNRFTDDTILTLAVADWLLHDDVKKITPDEAKNRLADKFVEFVRKHYRGYHAGYGFHFRHWIARCELIADNSPYNSFGNGSAMRVSPVAWYFDSIEDVRKYARMQADVTHNHPEGERGAEAVASAVFWARTGKDKEFIRQYIASEFGYNLSVTTPELRETAVFDETCQGSVPHALIAFLESCDFESAIRLAISYGGDCDTIACMTGSIAETYYGGVPENILSHCLPLMDDRILQIHNEMQYL